MLVNNKKNRSGMIVGVVVSVVAVSFLTLLAICYTVRRRRQKRHEDEGKQKSFMPSFSKNLCFSNANMVLNG